MKKIPLYVSFELTSRCNLNCEFCYSLKNIKELNLNNVKKIIKKLKTFGFRQIIFAGGEPLLRKDLKEILAFAKNLRINTYLSTNGILLSKKKVKELKNNLNWVCLSLDGPTEKVNSLLRGPGHFYKIIEALTVLNKTNIKVKINTLVGKPNIKYVEKIGDILNNFSCVKIWKLFQYTPRGNGLKNRKKFEVSQKKFLALSKILNKTRYNFTVTASAIEQRDSDCLLIQANGEITIPSGEDFLFLGNILKIDLKRVLNEKNFNFDKHYSLAKASYNL